MTTPEGEVKKQIVKLLTKYKIYSAALAGGGKHGNGFPEDAQGWYNSPVKGAFGVNGIPDFYGSYKGMFWAVEAKAPGKKSSGFQALQIAAIAQSGGFVCVVDGEESLKIFEAWLEGV
jgi:hypothetical protein